MQISGRQRLIQQILSELMSKKINTQGPVPHDMLVNGHLEFRHKNALAVNRLSHSVSRKAGLHPCGRDAPTMRTKQKDLPLLCQNQLGELKHVFGAEELSIKLECFLAEGDRMTGNIAHLISMREYPRLQSAAHKFGGSCALFGAMDLRASLSQLESACTRYDTAKLVQHEIHTQGRWMHTKVAMRALPYFR